jgi:hypothetical protein
MVMNKKAWMKVVEVFLSILLLIGVLSVLLINQGVQEKSKSEEIYKQESWALKEIQLNNSLRADVLNGEVTSNLNDTINKTMPDYLNCTIKICNLYNECNLDQEIKKEIYVKSILIFANNTNYNPKELKLFCWEK